MKLFYLLLFSLFMNAAAFAQGRWNVAVNGKTVLTATSENEEKNLVVIKTAELKKNREFSVGYNESKKAGWERFIALYDENDNAVKQQKGSSFHLTNAALAALFKQSKKVKIYTWALPTDPKRKAAIRVRRVHLCTLMAE